MEENKALEFFKAVANETRFNIVNLIKDKELSVNEIASIKKIKIIKGLRKGKHVYYTISDKSILKMIDQVYERVNQ